MNIDTQAIEEFCCVQTLKDAFNAAHTTNPDGGLCLEFGVGRGASFSWQVERIVNKYQKSKLIGFDAFKGLPKESLNVWCPGHHTEGALCWSRDSVFENFKKFGVMDYIQSDNRFMIVDGWFRDTLTPELRNKISEIGRLIFVNIDVDIYKSTIELLNFIGPLLNPGVILYWDDWLDPIDVSAEHPDRKWGEHLAWEQWSANHPWIKVETMCVNSVNQRYMKVLSV